jgi:hypothetical protein
MYSANTSFKINSTFIVPCETTVPFDRELEKPFS